MTAKKLYLWLAIAVAVGTLLGIIGKMAYDRGCEVTEVKKVSKAQIEQYLDIKVIKENVGDLKTSTQINGARIEDLKDDTRDIKSLLKEIMVGPKRIAQEGHNGLQNK